MKTSEDIEIFSLGKLGGSACWVRKADPSARFQKCLDSLDGLIDIEMMQD